jgi:thiamine-monophosphate kinase
VGEPITTVAAAYGTDPMPWVLGGGADHAFVGTVSADDDVPQGFARIGRVVEGAEPVVTVDGAVWSGSTGYTHFG